MREHPVGPRQTVSRAYSWSAKSARASRGSKANTVSRVCSGIAKSARELRGSKANTV